MAFYAQHDNTVGADAFKQQRERDALFKTLQEYQDLIRIKLSIWVRNGPSAALRQDIEEAASAYGEAFDKIMSSSPPRLTAIRSLDG